jgi:hypothetical protein
MTRRLYAAAVSLPAAVPLFHRLGWHFHEPRARIGHLHFAAALFYNLDLQLHDDLLNVCLDVIGGRLLLRGLGWHFDEPRAGIGHFYFRAALLDDLDLHLHRWFSGKRLEGKGNYFLFASGGTSTSHGQGSVIFTLLLPFFTT